jgi:hypothetical protein
MRLFDLLRLQEPHFDPAHAKVHLARYNQIDHPIEVYRRGEFDEWQRWQNGHNFNCALVVSLIQVGSSTRWMFAGLFRPTGHKSERGPKRDQYYYDLERLPNTADMEGRLFCTSAYTHRNSYVHCSTVHDMVVVELLAERISVGTFPGYKRVDLSKDDLDLLVRTGTESWRTALSSVKGIYLITDTKTGKLYVGKADGEGGIWGRWSQYSSTGHGFNKALVKELGLKAGERQRDLRFSLLEIADLQSAPGEIDARESHWKDILMTRTTGYNLN